MRRVLRMGAFIVSMLASVTVALAHMGEYAINRTLDGQDWIFLIYFLKDETGAWRLDAM